MNKLLQDLITFIGRRVVTANQVIRPKIGAVEKQDGLSQEEIAAVEESIEQEAIYLIGLADGMELARYINLSRPDKEQNNSQPRN